MVAKPGSLAPHSLIKWTWSGVKLFGGLLDFPGRPGVSYFLAWLGMKIFIFNSKDALTIFFTQCYLATILRSASLPLKHSTIQLVYWAEIVHFLPSSTRMVASFEISWAGMGLINYNGMDCEFFWFYSLVLCLNCANLHVPCCNWLRINTIYITAVQNMGVLQQIWFYGTYGGISLMCQNTTMRVYGA